MDTITAPILIVSILLQLAAAVFAIVLAKRTRGPGLAWLFISLALFLMCGRGAITLISLLVPALAITLSGPISEMVVLVTAILLVVGVLQVPQVFRTLQDENEQLTTSLDKHKRLSRSLKNKNNQVEHALDHVPGLIIATDSRGMIRMLGGQGGKELGPAADWAVGRSVAEVYGYAPWLRDGMERALLGQTTTAAGSHNGTIYRVHLAPLGDGTRWSGGIIGVALPAGDEDALALAVMAAAEPPAGPPPPALDPERLNQQFMAMASQELSGPLAGLGKALSRLAALSRDPTRLTEAPEEGERSAAEADRQFRRLVQRLGELFEMNQVKASEPARPAARSGVSDLSVLLFQVAERLEQDAAELRSPLLIQAPLPVIGPWAPVDLERLVTGLLTQSMRLGAGRPVEVSLSLEEEVVRLVVHCFGGEAMPDSGLEASGIGRIAEQFGGMLYLHGDRIRGATATVYLPVAPAAAGVPLPPEPREGA